MYRLGWISARRKAHPDLVHRAGPARDGGRIDAVRAQAARGGVGRALLDPPARAALHRARAAGRRRVCDREAGAHRPAAPPLRAHGARAGGARRVARRPCDGLGRAARALAPEALLRRRPEAPGSRADPRPPGQGRRVRGHSRRNAGDRRGRTTPGARHGDPVRERDGALRGGAGGLGFAPRATAAEPRPAQLPLKGGREGAIVKLTPILTATVQGPIAWFLRADGRLAWRKAFGFGVPKDQWVTAPVQCFLVEHPGAGP